MSPRISFEPIGVEIECDEDETILDAAFREGWNLVHGCREGQCTACKSFLLEGEVSHDRYSPDALSESEESQGYTLLCRALPDTDEVVVEPGGAGSLAPGDELAFTGPYGSMALRPGDRPVLLVAGGSGIGPILSLLGELAAAEATRPVRFFYGARTEADLPLREEIAALGARLADFAFVPVLSEEEWDGVTGLVHDAAAAAAGAGELPDPVVCACGPPPMIEALVAVLTNRHGVPEQDIAFDKFTPSAAGIET